MTLTDVEIIKRAKEIRASRLKERKIKVRQKIIESTLTPTPLSELRQRYPVIYIDPPWRYDHFGFGDRSPENHYDTMTDDEIYYLPIKDIATDSAVLYCWSTNTHLAKGIAAMQAWGFDYLTNIAWVKNRIGLGCYIRNQHELLLIGRKGTVLTPDPADRPPSVIMTDRTEHSSKPIEIYELIERMYPDLPKIEIFARLARSGWDRWGNHAG